MIAKTRAPLAVKDLSLRYAFVRSPVLQSAPESSRALLIPPSRSSPAFLLSILDRLERGCANFRFTQF